MKKFYVLAAAAAVAFGLGGLTANAGVMPGIGEAAKSASEESKPNVVEQVTWNRHHRHHRHRHWYGSRNHDYGYGNRGYGRSYGFVWRGHGGRW